MKIEIEPGGGSPARTLGGRRFALAVAWAALVGAAACFDAPFERDVLLRPGGDILAAGEAVTVRESATGDVMLAGRSVDYEGVVDGSFLGAGGDVRVRGMIDGSVRAAGGKVHVDATVERNATLAGGEVELVRDGEIVGNAYMAGGSVHLTGIVGGSLYAGGRRVVIDGMVGEDVRVEAESLRIGPEAVIGGELRYRLAEGAVADIAPSASMVGGAVALEPREDSGDGGIGLFALRVLGFVLFGTIVVALFPRTTEAMSDRMTAGPAAALGLGFLWVLLVPLAVLVTAATVVGIPFALVVLALYAMSLYAAPVVPALWLGHEIVRGRGRLTRGDAALAFAAGGLIVALAIVLPWVGFLARAVATCFGLGAVVLWLRERGGEEVVEAA